MKLYLNIFLVVIVCFNFSFCKRTEETTREEDGTIKTVITEEWETEERRGHGRGRGRGDTIVIMTNDNENVDNQYDSEESRPNSVKPKTVQLNRLYDGKTGYHFSTDQQEQSVLGKAGYKFDASLGSVVIKREDFPECEDLVPVTRVKHASLSPYHTLVVTSALVRWWTGGGWNADTVVIGYAVLEKGKCGATAQVRQLIKDSYIQTTNDDEYKNYKSAGFGDGGAPIFYVWGESDNFVTPQISQAIKDKTAVLTRLNKEIDYHYSVDQKEKSVLEKAGYKFDGTLGRIVVKQTDFPECGDLVPITRVKNLSQAIHVLVTSTSAVVQWWITGGWNGDTVVIGHAVSEKGKCGATVQVRHLIKDSYIQISNNAEYGLYKTSGYGDGGAPVFYIWEA
jgi:hypothetical protein